MPRFPVRSCLLLCLLLSVLPARSQGLELWAASDGRAQAAGTAAEPLSLDAAQRRAREHRRLATAPLTGPVRIILRGGTYALPDVWQVRPEDSGTAASPTIFEAAPGEVPEFSGGVRIAGWRRAPAGLAGLPAAAAGRVWVADAPRTEGLPLLFRQLWVGERKAVRARTPNDGTMDRLLEWDVANEQAFITPPAGLAGDTSAAELVIYQQWENACLRLASLEAAGDRLRVRFRQPESKVQFEHPWPAPIMTEEYRAPYFLANALCFLDQPGEWYHDAPNGLIYYWPREDEDLTRAAVVVPARETLLVAGGTLDRPLVHVQFKGLRFTHTTWLRPSLAGHVPHQAGFYMTEAYKLRPKGTAETKTLDNQAWVGRPPGAVMVRGAQHVRFERCNFEHLASAGWDAEHGVSDSSVEGCVFRDIGGNGIQFGKFQDGPIETHVPYRPADEREVCARVRLANNLVTDCGNEDWGCPGITVGYAREITIEHNEVSHLPYTGISVGWGWTRQTTVQRDNRVRANHIHHVARILYDTAGIYMLAAQPGTVVSENHIHDLVMSPYTAKPHWGYIYLDEGSSHTMVRDNWLPEDKLLLNNNGPGNVFEHNGPDVPAAIRDAAGLQPAYRDLLAAPLRP